MSATLSHSFVPVVGAIIQTAGCKHYEVVVAVQYNPDGRLLSFDSRRFDSPAKANEKAKQVYDMQKMIINNG